MKTALAVALTTTRALTRPTGAEQVPIGIMAPGRAYRKEPAHGMHRLPVPLQNEEDGKGPQG